MVVLGLSVQQITKFPETFSPESGEEETYENKNPSKHIPQPWRDLRVSNNRSRSKSLRLGEWPQRARQYRRLDLRIYAVWDADDLYLWHTSPAGVGL